MTIQAQSTTGSPEWGPSLAWGDVTTVWASVAAEQADESFAQKGVATATAYVVRIRYRNDISAANRLAWRGQVLDIVGVIDTDCRRRELELRVVSHG